ncbi:unnamed protein product, partial [Coregonus sp. 'balchen']
DRGRRRWRQTIFSPEEYEEYKRTVLLKRLQNRLCVSFGRPGGIDCKLIGLETPCFCTHRYKPHQTDFEEVPFGATDSATMPVFEGYANLNGSQPVRCSCKHSAHDHSETTEHLCGKCTFCSGFRSPYTCGCGHPSPAHQTLVKTRAEREARGWHSLTDGYLTLDDSGAEESYVIRALSDMRTREEGHMAYFERRYQEGERSTILK